MHKILNSLIFILVTAIAVWLLFVRSGVSVGDIEYIEPQSLAIEDIAVPENVVPEISRNSDSEADVPRVQKNNILKHPVKTVNEQAVEDKKIEIPFVADDKKINLTEKEKKQKVSQKTPTVPRAPPVKKNELPVKESAVQSKTKKDTSITGNLPTPSPSEKVEKKKVLPEYIRGWMEEFTPDGHRNGIKFVDDWKREGGIMFTPKTRFYLKEDSSARDGKVLVIESKKSSAVFAHDLSGKVDLNKTPLLRWRWRVKKLPPFGDGRHRKKDDQAVGIYIGAGNVLNQKAIAYRWETETPQGHWGQIDYSKMMRVWFLCMRNKDDGLNVWFEETRNVKEDFIARYGYVPEKIALVICGNSQNSKSDALAEIDFIGFYKEVKK